MMMKGTNVSGKVNETSQEDMSCRMTLIVNESLPIKLSNCHLVHVRRDAIECSSESNSCFLSLVMDISILTESRVMPRNSTHV